MRGLLAGWRRRLRGPLLLSAVAGRGAPRRALLLYATRAFRPGFERASHQNVPQQRELAAALGERGYEVDVADYDETRRGVLAPAYDLVVDLHPRATPVYAGRLTPGAVRIAYITGTNPTVANAAERARLDDVARLRARRQQPPFPREALEGFEAVFLIGNGVTLATYDGYRLPAVQLLPNSAWDDLVPTPPERRQARRFLYLGSAGQVHKGLDLLLELFAREPGLELVVCGDFRREPDFARAYRRELFATPNILAPGWMDLRSDAFRELQAECGTMLLPSCAEGQAGTVSVALAFGLPCAVSRECGFDDTALSIFTDCRPDTLREAVRGIAACPAAEVTRRSVEALALFRQRYRPEHYAAAVRAALDTTLAASRPAGAKGVA